MLTSYRELKVWEKSIELVVETYRVTNLFPKSEQYGLTSQMRRAAVSIPSNIAEGYTRNHRAEYVQFLKIAAGSGAELETQVIIAKKLNFVSEQEFKKLDILLDETMKMLSALVDSLNPKP